MDQQSQIQSLEVVQKLTKFLHETSFLILLPLLFSPVVVWLTEPLHETSLLLLVVVVVVVVVVRLHLLEISMEHVAVFERKLRHLMDLKPLRVLTHHAADSRIEFHLVSGDEHVVTVGHHAPHVVWSLPVEVVVMATARETEGERPSEVHVMKVAVDRTKADVCQRMA